VSRNGTDFEKRILANEKDNVKFQFLQPTSPFHAYYQFKIAESKAADATPAAGAGAAVTPTPAAPAAPPKAAVAAAAMKAVGPPAAEMYTVRSLTLNEPPRPHAPSCPEMACRRAVVHV
jgi:splicing factor 3A subunit 1